MKQTKNLFVIVLILLCKAQGYGQPNDGFLLEGTIEGLPDKSRIAMVTADRDTVAATTSVNNNFQIIGKVNGADFYFLLFDSTVSIKPSNALWLENKRMKVKGELAQIRKLKLSESRSQRVYEAFLNITDSGMNWTAARSLINFAKAYNDSYFTPFAILKLNDYITSEEKKTFYSSLGREIQLSTYGIKLKESILVDSLSQFLKVGSTLINFKVSDKQGTPVQIHEIISKNEVTLIDFWASWCSPCRRALPKLKSAYERFSQRGFNIVGISIDKKTGDWCKALAEDNTPWNHFVDNIEQVESKLSISGIPAYILVNKEGQILAKYILSTNEVVSSMNNSKLSTDLEAIVSVYLP